MLRLIWMGVALLSSLTVALCVPLVHGADSGVAMIRYQFSDVESTTPAPPPLAPMSDEVNCLAENIYFEARGEDLLGREAVAWVTMNRVTSNEFPNTVCDVVHQISYSSDRSVRWAEFSWTFEGHGAPTGTSWEDAKLTARQVYALHDAGFANPWNDPNVMFYHADYVPEEGTAWFRNNLVVENQIGQHIFYALPA